MEGLFEMDGFMEGDFEGFEDGTIDPEGAFDFTTVGFLEGLADVKVGLPDGAGVGDIVGAAVGDIVGAAVVGAAVVGAAVVGASVFGAGVGSGSSGVFVFPFLYSCAHFFAD